MHDVRPLAADPGPAIITAVSDQPDAGGGRHSPSYRDLKARDRRASRAAQGASRKRDTRCELLLRRRLWALGYRYRIDVQGLQGRPDIVFPRERVAIFCDGDFWHGRDLDRRVERLQRGHNAPYWVEKIRYNVLRDRRNDGLLEYEGWTVLRFWETDIRRDLDAVVARVVETLAARRHAPAHGDEGVSPSDH